MPPFVTIVIPTLNEELHIENCLNSLCQQSYPQNFYEIVVVDNGSEDHTIEKVKKYDVKLLFEAQRSAYCARNLAILKSAGDYLAFIDADCIADPQWLENLVSSLETAPALIGGGMIVYDIVTNTFANRLLVERNSPEQRKALVCDSHAVAGGNMIVKRIAFEQYGLFKLAAYSSDIEFSQRLAEAGVYPVFAENAVVHHQCDLSNWEYLWRTYETKKSQVLHNSQLKSWKSLIQVVRQVPWQPGLSHLLQSLRNENSTLVDISLPEWLYRWLERWFAYAGLLTGHWVAVRSHSDQLTQYLSSPPIQINNDDSIT